MNSNFLKRENCFRKIFEKSGPEDEHEVSASSGGGPSGLSQFTLGSP